MRPRKSSLSITLVLIGAAALGGCGREPDRALRRDVYASLEDCRADWGRAEDCELTSNLAGSGSSTSTNTRSGYYGPRYYWSSGDFDDSRPRPGSRAQRVETLARSGVASSSSSSSRSSSGSSSHSTSSVSRGGFGSSASSHGASS